MAARSENCAGINLESGCERSRHHQRSGYRRLRNPSDASPAKVHLGQVGLSSPHRQLNFCDSEAVTLNEPKYWECCVGVNPNQMLIAIVEDHGSVVAARDGRIPFKLR